MFSLKYMSGAFEKQEIYPHQGNKNPRGLLVRQWICPGRLRMGHPMRTRLPPLVYFNRTILLVWLISPAIS